MILVNDYLIYFFRTSDVSDYNKKLVPNLILLCLKRPQPTLQTQDSVPQSTHYIQRLSTTGIHMRLQSRFRNLHLVQPDLQGHHS